MTDIAIKAGLFGKDAGFALDYQFANFGFSDSGQGSITGEYDVLDTVGINYELGMKYDLEFGLVGNAHLDLGHIEGTMSYEADAVASDLSDVDGTIAAFVDTSGSTIGESTFDVTAPLATDSYISVDMTAKLKADLFGHLGGWYDTFIDSGEGRVDFDQNIVDLDLSQQVLRLTAADLGGIDGELYRVDLGFGELAAGLPEFEFGDAEIDGEGPLATQHMTGTSSPLLTLEVDLDSFLLPVGNAFDYGYGLFDGAVSLGVDIGIIDAKLVGTASLEQDITWTPDIDVTMTSSLGETLTGDLGDKFEFTTPEGEGAFTVTAGYHSTVSVATVTSLVLATSIDWKMAYGEAFFAVDLFGLYQDQLGFDISLIEGSEPLGAGISFELSADTSVYDLGTETYEYTVYYENFVTAASGSLLTLTTHQLTIDAGDIDNIVNGNALDNVLNGNGGRDKIRGRGGDDTISGGDGNDVLFAGRGSDTLVGGYGIDTAVFKFATEAVTVDMAAGTASGRDTTKLSGIERVRGSRFDDTLIGDGTSRLEGGAGADRLVGGRRGTDTASYTHSEAAVTIDLTAGTGLGGDAEGDRLSGIARVIGSGFADTLIGSAKGDWLTGGGGADTLLGGGGADRFFVNETAALIDGGSGRDTVIVSEGTVAFNDANLKSVETIRIVGSATVDLTGLTTPIAIEIDSSDRDGRVLIRGGTAGDTVTQVNGGFRFDGGAGDDVLHATTGAAFNGGAGYDTLIMDGGGALGFAIDGVEHIVLTEVATASFAASFGVGIPGLLIDAVGGTITGDGGDDTIRIGDLGAIVAGGGGNDRIELGDGADVVRVTDRFFGEDTVAGFDFDADTVDFSGSGITVDSVAFAAVDGGSELTYHGYSNGRQIVASITFEGISLQDAVAHIDLVF